MMRCFVLAILCTLSACQTRPFNEESGVVSNYALSQNAAKDHFQGTSATSPNSLTYVYSYTDDPSALSDPKGFLEREINSATRKNAMLTESSESTNIQEGYGIYAAADPLISHDYGAILVVIPVLPRKTAVVHQDISWAQRLVDIKGTAPAIAYRYHGGIVKTALVIRSTEIIDVPNVKS